MGSVQRTSRFPRSCRYDLGWTMSGQMGPNPLWLCEWLCEHVAIGSGMRILDLGCGSAQSSIFLAREFDAQVWATDLWVAEAANRERIAAAGEQARVTAVQ